MDNHENLLVERLKKYPEMMRVKHLQDFLDTGRNQAYDLCHDPTFPAIRVGDKSIRIPKSMLIEWLKHNAQK